MAREKTSLNRRELLGAAAVSALPLGLVGAAGAKGASESVEGKTEAEAGGSRKRRRVLRVGHMTDTHIEPKRGAPKGLARALEHMQSQDDPPKLLLLGGDTVMDSCSAPADWTAVQWKTFHEVMKQHCHIPVKACIGNHDVWGLDKVGSHTSGKEPLWGKRRAVHELRLPGRYYMFEQAGWRFIMLDGTFIPPESPHTYVARLDDEQLDWLETTIKTADSRQPIMLVSHMPILSVAVFRVWSTMEHYQTKVNGQFLISNYRRLIELFDRHANVRLCLSGHLHLVDHAVYNGVHYVCDGAVSGAWWRGNQYECDEGYGLIDLYDDGTFEHRYVSYHWQVPT